MNRKKLLICISTILIFVGVLSYLIIFKEKDYSFEIKKIDIGTENIYVKYEVGNDIDGESSWIEELVISNGVDKIILNDCSTIKTDDENVFIEKYYLQSNFPKKKEKEIVASLKKIMGKEVSVSAKLHIKDKKSQEVTCKILYKINDFMSETNQKINTPFVVDDNIVKLKSITFDKYFMTLNIENEDDVDSYVFFDVKDDNNYSIQNLGGDGDRQIFWNKKDLKNITISAYTKEHPLDDDAIKIKVPIK